MSGTGDPLLQHGFQQIIVAWDTMVQRYAHVTVGGGVLARLELLLGAADNNQLGLASSEWQRCWSNSVRHGFLRAFGHDGYYDVDDHLDAFDDFNDDDDDDNEAPGARGSDVQRGPGPWLPRFIFGR